MSQYESVKAKSCEETAYLLDLQSVLLFVSGLESLPGLVGRDVTDDAVHGEQAVGLALGGNVAGLLADAANLGLLLGTVSLAVASLATATALSAELALDGRVWAVALVVARLVAVVAETGVAAAAALLWLLGAVAGEVALGAAAVMRQLWSGEYVLDDGKLTCDIRRRRAWKRSGRGSQSPRRRQQHLEPRRRW